jgi:hypothetical protein
MASALVHPKSIATAQRSLGKASGCATRVAATSGNPQDRGGAVDPIDPAALETKHDGTIGAAPNKPTTLRT